MKEYAGTLLDSRYLLHSRVGTGGYGDVWRARDEHHGVDVAVKLVDVSDPSVDGVHAKIERVRREAMMLGRIRHPNVVSILDIGVLQAQNVLFLVTEFLNGHTLEHELATHGPLDTVRAIARTLETLDGLEAVHAAGIVHKDLKPANLFLHRGPRGECIKLIDFGIGRIGSLNKLTTAGRLTGSPRYMAPEYILGNTVSEALDLYQVGLILAEVLTGEPCIPRGLKLMEICQRHVLGDLNIADSLRGTALGEVIARATQRKPERRYRSAAEFARALGALPRLDQVAPSYAVSEHAKTVAIPVVKDFVEGAVTAEEIETLRELDAKKRPQPPPPAAERKRLAMPKWAIAVALLAVALVLLAIAVVLISVLS